MHTGHAKLSVQLPMQLLGTTKKTRLDFKLFVSRHFNLLLWFSISHQQHITQNSHVLLFKQSIIPLLIPLLLEIPLK